MSDLYCHIWEKKEKEMGTEMKLTPREKYHISLMSKLIEAFQTSVSEGFSDNEKPSYDIAGIVLHPNGNEDVLFINTKKYILRGEEKRDFQEYSRYLLGDPKKFKVEDSICISVKISSFQFDYGYIYLIRNVNDDSNVRRLKLMFEKCVSQFHFMEAGYDRVEDQWYFPEVKYEIKSIVSV